MHARTPSVGTLGGLQTGPPVVAGPHRERRKPKPVMNGLKKSDGAIRPVREANKGAHAPAEPPEERASTKGNPGSQSTHRTQCRASVTQAADRIRQAVERNPKERLTALFHHITPEALGAAYLALRKDAAAGVDGVTWSGVWRRTGRALARPAPTPAPWGSVPSAASAAGRDTQAGRRDTTARDCGTGGQDRPEGGCGGDPDTDLRGGVSRFQLRVPAGARI